jgi:hypothetical protein
MEINLTRQQPYVKEDQQKDPHPRLPLKDDAALALPAAGSIARIFLTTSRIPVSSHIKYI